MFAGCSVVSDLLFTPVDIGKDEVSCYDYNWWFFVVCIVLAEIRARLVVRGSVIGGKVNGFISCKMNCCPYYFTVRVQVGQRLGNILLYTIYICVYLRFRVHPRVTASSATRERAHRSLLVKDGAWRARTHPAATETATSHVLRGVVVDEEVLVRGSVGSRTRALFVTVVRNFCNT